MLTLKDLECLIHPQQAWVELRRSNQEPISLKGTDVLTLPDLLSRI